MQKMDTWFQTLDSGEQAVISGLVRAAFLHSASEFKGAGATGDDVSGYIGYNFPLHVVNVNPAATPNLFNSMNNPGLIGTNAGPTSGAALVADMAGQYPGPVGGYR
jgi:hypothetical protein